MSMHFPAPVPVYMLTGFLGSGKTTLLRKLIHEPAFADTAVVMNEFGEIGLDHVLLEKSDDSDIALLASGCLCCATNNPLQETLETLYYKRLRGEVPAFGRVVVETSGLADPAPLMNALASDRNIEQHFRLCSVVTAVDAVHGEATLGDYAEAHRQLLVADTVVLTKTDIASNAQIQKIDALISVLNPSAQRLDPSGVQDGMARFLDSLLQMPVSVRRVMDIADDGHPRDTPFAHLMRYGIVSHTFRVPQQVSWQRYAAWVAIVQRQFGEKLLRAKGILALCDEGESADHEIHGVHHLFSPPRRIEGVVPDAQSGVLVVILRDTTREEFSETLAALAAPKNLL